MLLGKKKNQKAKRIKTKLMINKGITIFRKLWLGNAVL